jgi:hypothetical protein
MPVRNSNDFSLNVLGKVNMETTTTTDLGLTSLGGDEVTYKQNAADLATHNPGVDSLTSVAWLRETEANMASADKVIYMNFRVIYVGEVDLSARTRRAHSTRGFPSPRALKTLAPCRADRARRAPCKRSSPLPRWIARARRHDHCSPAARAALRLTNARRFFPG